MQNNDQSLNVNYVTRHDMKKFLEIEQPSIQYYIEIYIVKWTISC